MAELKSRPLFEIDLTVAAPQLVGATPAGDRRIFLVIGGRFEGDRRATGPHYSMFEIL